MTEKPPSDALHRTLLEAVIRHFPAAVVVAESPSGRVLASNAHVATIFRHDVPQTLSVADYAAWKAVHQDGRPFAPEDWPLARALAGEHIEREEVRIVRGDGTIGIIRVSAAPVYDADGALLAATCTFSDVTDERREQEALVFLAEASAIVAESLEYEETLHRIVQLAIPQFAELAFIYLLDAEGQLQRQEFAAADPARRARVEAMWRRFPTNTASLRAIIESGVGVLRARVEENDWSYVADPEHRRMLHELGIRSAISVPMRTAGRTFGTMSFALTSTAHEYDDFDLLVAEELARRAVVAIDRSRLFASEREQRILAERAARRIEHLQELTGALSPAITIDQVGDAALHQVIDITGATVAVMGVVEGDHLRIIRTIGLAPGVSERFATVALDSDFPIAIATRTKQPVWLHDRTEASVSPIIRTVPEARGQAWASLPLESHGTAIGVLGLSFGEQQRFDDDDQRFLRSVAGQCAIALERALLFERERHAREEAERASRAKDDFLAVLSHELRTPMTTVIGWADFLRMTRSDDEALLGPLESLRASAKVQAKLVDDLLDVSRIVSGKLPITKRDTDVLTIVRSSVDSVRMSAEQRGVTLDFADGPAVPVYGDPDRLQQIVTNLLVNAIKFTPPEGRVTVRVIDRDDEVDVIVQDTGEGISPDFLPHVFDRFRQASIGDSRRHSGLGLGLSIVQHLVQLHGGRVAAASEGLGKGATFTVTLPARNATPAPR